MTEKITQVTYHCSNNGKDEIFAVCTEQLCKITKKPYWYCTFYKRYSLHTAAEFAVTFFNSSIVNATEILFNINEKANVRLVKSKDNTPEHYLKEISSQIYFG